MTLAYGTYGALLHHPCDWIFYKHHRWMEGRHYKSINTNAKYPFEWMFYDTRHREMDSMHDVCLDISWTPADFRLIYNKYHNDTAGTWHEWVDVHFRNCVKKMKGREINRSDFIKKFLTLNFIKIHLVGVMLFHVERQRQVVFHNCQHP